MNSANCGIGQYLVPGSRVHLIGIGGVSMRPLAYVLRDMGLSLSGSDMTASPATEDLVAAGIPVCIGHQPENIGDAVCIIRTAAAHNDNPEIAAAREKGIPVFERAQAWGHIMKSYREAICVSGTHGKTTTTSMVTHIFMEAAKDPTVMIGGKLPLLASEFRVGQGDTIILESCEYCNSYHNFFPTTAVLLNIEADHLDFFKDLEDVKKSFRTFARIVPEGGILIANGDDKNTMDALQGLPAVTFGMSNGVRVQGRNFSPDYREFDVYADGTLYCRLQLAVVGKHNAYNALAACCTAFCHSIDGETAARGLSTFTGAGRRMEFKGRWHGAEVYDDYAHHPGELKALFRAARTMDCRRIVCAFQPHTYTRTKALFEDFVTQLQAPDVLILAEIYAAREQNLSGISSRDLAAHLPGSVYCATLPEVTKALSETVQEGDLVLTVGAGDIFKAGKALLEIP